MAFIYENNVKKNFLSSWEGSKWRGSKFNLRKKPPMYMVSTNLWQVSKKLDDNYGTAGKTEWAENGFGHLCQK